MCDTEGTGSLSRPKLTIMTINIEGLSISKEELLKTMCQEINCDILCIQETHRDNTKRRPRITGMQLAIERPHRQYGSAIFVKPNVAVLSASLTEKSDIEILTIELSSCTVTSVYKPPNVKFNFTLPQNFQNQDIHFVVGDFNSHSSIWGYESDDENGKEVIKWADSGKLFLLHDSKLPPSFNSGRWKRGYNPDLVFVSDIISHQCVKTVTSPIPGTQHRPMCCQVFAAVRPRRTPFRRRFNFRKANWRRFTESLDEAVLGIEPIPDSYENFIETVKKCSRVSIPRGCRRIYIPGMNEDLSSKMQEYLKLFEENPFSTETMESGLSLSLALAEAKQTRWIETLESIDMSKSSRKAWQLLKRLSNDPITSAMRSGVTPNQVAHQVLQNGKTGKRRGKTRIVRQQPETNILSAQFTMKELLAAIKKCKIGKAPGLDDLMMEQIKHFGPVSMGWLLQLYNSCLSLQQIPKTWRKTRIIAILKPGKKASDAKNFRPISLLCHLHKILERMLLNRLSPMIEPQLIPQQAGFRPNKNCTAQILNLAQNIEDGFELGLITGAVFVDLSAAYDTVQHNIMLNKLYNLTRDYDFTNFIRILLQNRRFYVELDGMKSRWRRQKSGLPQGSVLSPVLFNIYSNDQPQPPNTKSFIYADDLALISQAKDFETVESCLTNGLDTLTTYYKDNHLKPNQTKTQVCAFHLRNKDANRKLRVIWEGVELEHCHNPKYLGVTLDRTLTYKKHCLSTKQKVSARNNIIRKLTSSGWGAQPRVLRTSALALCYSTAEYACPVWYRSAHSRQVDVALNETCRIITGCLKATPSDKLYSLAGIAPPDIRREVAASIEKRKVEQNDAHPLYGHQFPRSRLKSRKSFLKTTTTVSTSPRTERQNKWRARSDNTMPWISPSETLPPGGDLQWKTWKSLNRLRSGVGRTKDNLARWNYLRDPSTLCECGAEQTTKHLYKCPRCPAVCTLEDLLCAKENAVEVANFWSDNI